jgi:hypothetical protein
MKMFRTILIQLFILSFVSSVCVAQHFEEDLLTLEHQAYRAQNDTVRNVLLFQKFQLFVANAQYGARAFSEAKRVQYQLLPDTLKWKYLWNASLIAYLNGDRDYTSFYGNCFRALHSDTLIAESTVLHAFQNMGNDSLVALDVATLSARDTIFGCMRCLGAAGQSEKFPTEARYVLASALIPGSGMFLLGDARRGATALAINAGIGVLVYLFCKEALFVNAFGWGAALITKFYFGNMQLTRVLHQRKLAKRITDRDADCQMQIKTKLQKYPLRFM